MTARERYNRISAMLTGWVAASILWDWDNVQTSDHRILTLRWVTGVALVLVLFIRIWQARLPKEQ